MRTPRLSALHRSRTLPRTRSVFVALSLAFVLLLAACSKSGGGSESAVPSTPPPAEPRDLSVLVYNIEYQGGENTDAVTRKLDADIVGVLESYSRLPEIAENTGYPYYNSSLQLLSKYPIHEPAEADGRYALVEVEPGYVVAVFNVHLDYVKWGLKLFEKGKSVDEVIASENEVRTSAMEVPFAEMDELAAQGYPVFLTGDFNQPSSLDFTAEFVATGRYRGIDEPVPWPVSEALFEKGFRDTYREAHPDPVKAPGITQSSSDSRIDYVYAAGPSTTVTSQLVGEKGADDVEIGFPKWTSDHFAVLSNFEVTPVPMPTTVSVDARLGWVGDDVTISYNTPGVGDGRVAVVPEGGDPADPIETLDAPGESGSVTFGTDGLQVGGYEAILQDADGGEVSRISFWLRDPDAEIRLSTDEDVYAPGDPITVTWDDGPANRWDWVSIYPAGEEPDSGEYLVWQYTNGHASGTVPPTVSGSLVLDGDANGGSWPLPPGDYVVYYLMEDEYNAAGSVPLTIEG